MAWTKEDRAELNRAIRDAFGDAMKGMTSSTRRVRRRASNAEDTEEAFDDMREEVEDLTKTIKKLQETSKGVEGESEEYLDLLSKANAALRASTGSLKGLKKEVDELTHDSLLEQRDYIHRYSKTVQSLTTELGKQIRSSSLFGASLIAAHSKIDEGSTSYHEMLYELTQASGGLNSGLLKATGAWNDSANAIKEDLGPETFSKLRLSMDDARSTFAEAFGSLDKFGFTSFDDVLKKGEMELTDMFKTVNQTSEANSQLKDTMLKLAAELSAKGFDVGAEITTPTGEINTGVFDRLKSSEGSSELVDVIKNLANISRQGEGFARRTNSVAALSNSSIGKWVFAMRSAQREFGPFKGALFALRTKLAETATIGANLALFKASVKQAYQELTNFNISNIPKTFANVQVASVKLGMSFEDTVKFFQQNKRAMAIYGPEFDKFAGQLGQSFRKIGFTFEQASDAIAPLVESARHAAINLRDVDALTNFADQVAGEFQKMGTMTEVTAQEFARLNTELLSSEDIQRTLLGMDRAAAQQRAQDLILSRRHYVQMGLSLEQAQDMVKAQQAQQREAVVSRMRGAARAMMIAGQAGMSADQQMRIFQLASKGRRTEPDNKLLADLLKQAGAGLEQNIERGFQQSEAAGNIRAETARILQQDLGGLAEMLGLSRTVAVAERGGAQVTDAELEKAAALAKGSEAVGNFSQMINTASSFLNNSFVTGLFGGTAALIGLSVSATRAALSLGLMGGRGGGGAAGKLLKAAGSVTRGAVAAIAGAGAGTLAAVGSAAVTTATALGSAYRFAKGEDASNWISNLADKVGITSGVSNLIGKVMGGDNADPNAIDETNPEVIAARQRVRDMIARERGGAVPAVSAPASATAQPAIGIPPSVSQPATAGTTAGVNTPEAAAASQEAAVKTAEVQDITAHEFLSRIALGMGQAVDLLKALAESGNPAAMEAVAAQLRQQGGRQVPTANSYITGRQAHQ